MAKKAILAVATLAILGVLFLIVRGLTPGPPEVQGPVADTRPLPATGPAVAPGAPPDFIEQRDETGRLVRRLEFKDALPRPDRIEMTDLHVIFYDKPDTAGRIALTILDAGRALLHRKRTAVEKPAEPMMLDENLEFGDATLERGVHVFHDGATKDDTGDDIHFRTGSAVYREESGRLLTEDPVEGSGSGMWFRGTGLTADVKPETRRLLTVRVLRDVEIWLSGEAGQVLIAESGPTGEPRAAKAEGMPPTQITCRGEFSLLVAQRRATFYREVKVRQGEASMEADTLEVEFSPPREAAEAAPRGLAAAPRRFFGPPKGVNAKGKADAPLRLADPREGRQFTAEGMTLDLDVAARVGTLEGEPLATVRQGPKLDTVITARQFRFDRGDTRDLTYAEGEPTLTLFRPAETPDEKERTLRVTCEGPMKVDGNQLTAELSENVSVKEKQGDVFQPVLTSDRLEVFFARGAERERRVEKIAAAGRVDALQEGQRITAEKLTLTFDTADRREKPTTLEASGNVLMVEVGTPRKAQADKVVADLIKKRTTLTGTPATLDEGDRTMVADLLVVDQSAEAPVVTGTGPGRIVWTAQEGPDGKPLEKPVRYVVDWKKAMKFDPSDPKAPSGRFEGAVRADLGEGQTFECQRLDLLLKSAQPSGDTMPNGVPVRPMEIERIVAEEGVKFVSPEQEARGRYLTWDVDRQQATVKGTAEEPARVVQGDHEVVAPSIEMDRQREVITAVGPGYLRRTAAGGSVVGWRGRMTFKAKEGLAEFRDGVSATLAGADLRRRGHEKDLFVSPKAGDQEIKQIDLDCRALDITFEDLPDTDPRDRAGTRRVVRELLATDGVSVVAIAERVVRRFEGREVTFTKVKRGPDDAEERLICIVGGEDGWARFWSEEDPGTGAVFQDQLVSERILFYPDRGELLTEPTRFIEYTPRERLSPGEPKAEAKPATSRILWSRGGER